MSHCFSKRACCVVLAVIAAGLSCTITARADDSTPAAAPSPGPILMKPPTRGPGQKVQVSPPRDPINISNLTATVSPSLNRLNPTPSSFKQVQDDLFRPLANALNPVDSMQGVMSVPVQQQQHAPDKHTREMMDQRRNWAFTDLNELYPDQNAEEAFGVKQYGEDGKEKQVSSAIEKYMKRPDGKDARDPNNPWKQRNTTGDDMATGGTNVFNPMAQSFMGNDSFQKTIFAPGASYDDSSPGKSSSFDDHFAGNENDPASIQAKILHRNQMDRMMDRSIPLMKPEDAMKVENRLKDYMQPTAVTTLGLNETTAPQEHRSALNPVMAIDDPNAQYRSHIFDDPTAHALGMPNPLPQVKPAAPPKTAQSIESMLNPFAASAYKPKFQ